MNADLSGPGSARHLLKAGVAAAALCCGLAVLPASAQQSGDVGRRTALVIGNADYTSFPDLPNALPDVDRVVDVLQAANFEVTVGRDLNKQQLEETIRAFLRSLGKDDIALFYYGGHAVQVGGNNYLVPVDAALSSPYDLEVETYNVASLLAYMNASSAMQIAILDASYDNPAAGREFTVGETKAASAGRAGLAALSPKTGSLLVYSTAPDQLSIPAGSDGSPFTTAFSTYAERPNADFRDILAKVRGEVAGRTEGKQVPWDASGLTGEFYLFRQQGLMIVEAGREVRASPAATVVELGIVPPIMSGEGKLEVTFDALPAHGALWLGERGIDAGTRIAAADLPKVVLKREPGGAALEHIAYTARAESGQTASGALAVVFDPAVSAPSGPPVGGLVISAADEAEEEEQAAPPPAPVQLAMASDIGTGFVTISDADESLAAIAAGGWLRLTGRDPGTQVVVGNVEIAPGDLIKAEDIGTLRVKPSLASAGERVSVVIAPAVPEQKTLSGIEIELAVSVNLCDELAGEPLDVQGVTEGRFPNDIDIPAALAACRQAVADNPGVARLRYEYGRVLYASGDFDAALAEYRAAWDGGHVRAGQMLARLYQLGAGVERDPAAAIPYLEAAVAKGDPFAQNTLAKALIAGNGIAADIPRGIKLYTESAESGHTFAMNALGAEYLSGRNVEKDEARALRFFEASAARDDVWGYVNLGIMHRDGLGVAKDPARAKELFEKANAGGHPYAATLLGMMDEADGAPLEQVLAHYRTSAARGDAYGAVRAARIVGKDAKLEAEPGEAIRLLALGASQNSGRISEEAKADLAARNKREVAVEVQRALLRAGADIGEADGALGAKSREAIAARLGADAPSAPADILVELVRKEWIDSRPRLDML